MSFNKENLALLFDPQYVPEPFFHGSYDEAIKNWMGLSSDIDSNKLFKEIDINDYEDYSSPAINQQPLLNAPSQEIQFKSHIVRPNVERKSLNDVTHSINNSRKFSLPKNNVKEINKNIQNKKNITFPINNFTNIKEFNVTNNISKIAPATVRSSRQTQDNNMESSSLNTQKHSRNKPCNDWNSVGLCANGSNCPHSHATKEFSYKRRVTNFKAKPCVDPARGLECQYGSQCNFVHPGEELRRPMPQVYADIQYYTLLLRDFPETRYPFGLFM